MAEDIRAKVANEARRAVDAAWDDMMRDAGCGGDYFLWHNGEGALLVAKDWPEAPKGYLRATVNLGSVVDLKQGFVAAYVCENKDPKPGEPRYFLRGWAEDSKPIAPLPLRGHWKQGGFGGVVNTIYAWSCIIDGHVYSGRNSGPCMLIRMRRSRKATGRLNEPAH